MLILHRATNERIVLRGPDGKIVGTIVVVETGARLVRLGLDFQREIVIERDDMKNNTPKGREP